jgi:hypothetical protein
MATRTYDKVLLETDLAAAWRMAVVGDKLRDQRLRDETVNAPLAMFRSTKANLQTLGTLLWGLLGINAKKQVSTDVEIAFLRKAVRLLVAVSRYSRREGKPPASLSDLAGDLILPDDLNDVFGRPIVLRRLENGRRALQRDDQGDEAETEPLQALVVPGPGNK